MALLFALLSAACFGVAVVVSRLGLRTLDARRGAAISIPSAFALYLLAAPFSLELAGFGLAAAAIFALVGLFFPAFVTLLTFESNRRLGTVLTSTLSATAPLFAVGAAWAFLGEQVPARALAAALGVAAGVALISWRRGAAHRAAPGWAWGLPLAGALLRGVAQVLVKAGLALWPSPFAAGLIGYAVSAAGVLAADRLGRATRAPCGARGAAWFVLTGLLNGAAVLLMYAALRIAPVSLVAPIVAGYPLVTLFAGALVLREEPLRWRSIAGSAIAVASIVYLISR